MNQVTKYQANAIIYGMAAVGRALGNAVFSPKKVITGKGTSSAKSKRRAKNKTASASRSKNRK